MSATEIIQILKKGKPLTMIEISKYAECSLPALHKTMSSLKKDKSENIQFRELQSEEKKERYGRKIGHCVYVYWIDSGEMVHRSRQ